MRNFTGYNGDEAVDVEVPLVMSSTEVVEYPMFQTHQERLATKSTIQGGFLINYSHSMPKFAAFDLLKP